MVAFRDIFKYLKISPNTQETYLEISPNDLEISPNGSIKRYLYISPFGDIFK